MTTADSSLINHPLPKFIEAILVKLEKELASLRYHNLQHTRSVINDAITLAKDDSCCARDLELILVAAAFHDAGYLVSPTEHEQAGARFAEEAMRAENCFTSEEIALVVQSIKDTKLVVVGGETVQVANTRLSPYLLDADMAHFGRVDFREKSELLRLEFGTVLALKWWDETFKLVDDHLWKTWPAYQKWEKQKKVNLRGLREAVCLCIGGV